MANAYTQDIVLDADGKPVLDALTLVRNVMDGLQKTVNAITAESVSGAKKWQQELAGNLKLLKQAQSDLRVLQNDRQSRTKGFQEAEAAAKRVAQAEVRADREANSQKLVEARVFYRERERLAREEASVEKQLARDIAAFERSQDKAAIASAKEVAAARREAATAAVTAKARGITNRDDAVAAKAASDLRLTQLRREREAVAQNDADAARGLANRVALEKVLGRELDRKISQLARQEAAERKAQQAAEARMTGQDRLSGVLFGSAKLLAPGNVRDEMQRSSDVRSTLTGYQFEQELARRNLQAQIASKTATLEQVTAARQRLELANANVTSAQRLVREEERLAQLDARRLIAAEKLAVANLKTEERARTAAERQAAYDQKTSIPGRLATASRNLAIYGGVAGVGYGAFNAIRGGLENVIAMEDELAKLAAISNSTSSQMQQLRASIFDVASTSRFSTVDLIKISQTLAQAGVSAGEMTSVLKSVTTLATASGSTPDEAVNLVTSALGSFQLQASEASRVADLMTSALNRTKLTVQQTGQAIQYVGATAFEQNISLEQMLATVGAVAQAGVKSGSTIGTGFRQFLVDLQTPSEKLTEQLKALGLTQQDVDVSSRGLAAVLDTLKEAGFGSAQAYAGLETRAAAFYLTAKNNVDVMDQLQLSFADQGAAALANERAMNSLSAQWQRFKNLIGDGFAEFVEQDLKEIQGGLTSLNDFLASFGTEMDNVQARWREGWNGYASRNDGNLAGAALDYYVDKFWVIATNADMATGSTRDFSREIANGSEKISTQTGLISELDKEYKRLLVQKSSLIDNDVRSSAEMSSLMSRFEGLSGYLTNTKNQYVDLTNAVRGFADAQRATLIGDIAAQQSNIAQQSETLRRARPGLASAVRNSASFNSLTASEKSALDVYQTKGPGSPEFQRALQVLADAALRLASDKNNLGGKLDALVQNMRTGQINSGVQRGLTSNRNQLAGAVTPEGKNTTERLSQIGAELAKAQASGDTSKVQSMVTEAQTWLRGWKPKAEFRGFFDSALDELKSFQNQITALKTPTKAEERQAKAAERERDKQEKQVSQADIDNIGKALGLRLGSGTRTPEHQESLYRQGVTRARGVGDRVSNHVGGVARDFTVRGMSDAEAELAATRLRARYRAAGINAQVKYERGGPNDGTGRHIHVGVRKGTTRRTDRTDEAEDKYDTQLGQSQIALDEANLKTKLQAVAKATTTETFDAAVSAARAALDKVNSQLKGQAELELATNGFAAGDPQYDAKMLQVQQTIDQNIENFNQKIADGIIKSTEAQLKAAQTAFDAAVQPAAAALALAQGQLGGLDAYSLRNRVPDYVKSLAGDRVAAAQERVAQAEYNALPAQIAAQQAAINAAASQADAKGVTVETTAKLAAMNVELEKLVANRAALGAQLGAGGLIPTTFSDGLNQAIQAYRQANNLNETFSQSLTMNLGGALDQVNGGLTTMFTSILDGSQTALQAFGNFAKGVMQWMVQLAAKAVATQVFNLILGVIGGVGGGKVTASTGGGGNAFAGMAAFNGGLIGYPNSPYSARVVQHFSGGGEVTNGSRTHDSVDAKLARGEFVMQNSAVDSVGTKFMARLNDHGSKALESLQSVPSLDMTNHVESNIYVVPPDQMPPLGPNDIKVILNEELMNGDGKRLVEHISRSSR